MIGIVDYGLGNVQAFLNMFKRLGVDARRARTAGDLSEVSKLILPGVGAFDHAMEMLEESGMRAPLDEMVRRRKVPVLGVCVGMQMMAEGSDEGVKPGLGWIAGRVRSFSSNPSSAMLPLPHMGWNDVHVRNRSSLFSGFTEEPRFYFLHSYYFDCEKREDVVATADYGFSFACVVTSGNMYGVQCHPEKSHRFGVQLLRNFAAM